MKEKKSLLALWNENYKEPFWAEDNSGYRFYVAGVAPNKIAVGWGHNGADASFGALSPEWYAVEKTHLERLAEEVNEQFAYERP